MIVGFRLLFPLRASAVHPSLLYCFLPCYWPLSVGAQVNWRVRPSLKKSAGKAGESRVPWPALAWATGDTPLPLCVGRLEPSTQQRCAPKSCVQGHPLPFSLVKPSAAIPSCVWFLFVTGIPSSCLRRAPLLSVARPSMLLNLLQAVRADPASPSPWLALPASPPPPCW